MVFHETHHGSGLLLRPRVLCVVRKGPLEQSRLWSFKGHRDSSKGLRMCWGARESQLRREGELVTKALSHGHRGLAKAPRPERQVTEDPLSPPLQP